MYVANTIQLFICDYIKALLISLDMANSVPFSLPAEVDWEIDQILSQILIQPIFAPILLTFLVFLPLTSIHHQVRVPNVQNRLVMMDFKFNTSQESTHLDSIHLSVIRIK